MCVKSQRSFRETRWIAHLCSFLHVPTPTYATNEFTKLRATERRRMGDGTVPGGRTFKGTTRTRAPVSLLGGRRPEDSLLVARPVHTREAGEGGREGRRPVGATPSGRKIGYAPTPAFSLSASLQGPPRRFTREQPLRLSRGPGLGDWGGGRRLSQGTQGRPAPPPSSTP